MGNVIKKLDKDTNSEVGAITLTGGSNPSTFAYDTVTGYLWVACASSDTLHVINPVTLEELNVYNLVSGSYPYDMVFADGYLWIVCLGLNYVAKVDPTTGDTVLSISVGDDPSSIVHDGYNLWVANSNSSSISRIDPEINIVTATVGLPKNPRNLIYDKRKYLWITSIDQEIYVVDRGILVVKTTINTGVTPKYLEYDGDFIRATVAGAANKLSKISLVTEAEISNIAFDVAPNDVIFDGLYIWVQLPDENRIAKINKATDTIIAYAPVTGMGTLKRQGKQGSIRFHEWEEVGTLPVSGYCMGSVVNGNYLYVIGGGIEPTKVRRIDMTNWTAWDDTGVTDLPVGIDQVAKAFVYENYLWVFGTSSAVRKMLKLDLSNPTGEWEDLSATFPFIHASVPYAAGAIFEGNFLYQICGYYNVGKYQTVYKWDFSQNPITGIELPSYSDGYGGSERQDLIIGAAGQYLYGIGGYGATLYGNAPCIARLDLNSPTAWNAVSNIAGNIYNLSRGRAVQYGNYCYVVGGLFDSQSGAPDLAYNSERVYRFDPTAPLSSNMFVDDIPHLPVPLNYLDVTVHDGYLYVIGGRKVSLYADNDSRNYLGKIFRLNLVNFS